MTEEQAKAIAAPDSHWPLSEDARRWVELHKPAHERQFDREAYEEFMRGLSS